MLEYEKKVMLTKDEYAVLADRCKGMCVEMQTNYYFDTDDLNMNRQGITCRIRAKNGTYRMTVKNHCRENPNCSIEEHLCESAKFDPRIFEALGLRLQGELITSRIIMYRDTFCEMVLDRNTYMGCTDYELEVEYSEGCETRALDCLKSVADCLIAAKITDSTEEYLHRIGKGKSKSERFFGWKQLAGG
jgi:uncharacterized protein YjbK